MLKRLESFDPDDAATRELRERVGRADQGGRRRAAARAIAVGPQASCTPRRTAINRAQSGSDARLRHPVSIPTILGADRRIPATHSENRTATRGSHVQSSPSEAFTRSPVTMGGVLFSVWCWRCFSNPQSLGGRADASGSGRRKHPCPGSGLPGVPVAYLPATTKSYLGSASVVALSATEYVVTHDVFGPGSTRDRTYVYGSVDAGKNWSRRAEIVGQWWSGLFLHTTISLYLMGTSAEYGFCVIRRSTDGGRSWTNPWTPNRGFCWGWQVSHRPGSGCGAWRAGLAAMEDAQGPGGWGHHFRALMMSAPVDADLLNAAIGPSRTGSVAIPIGWGASSTARLARRERGRHAGRAFGKRVAGRQPLLAEVAAIVGVSQDGKEIAFNPERDFVKFPGGSKKFSIRWNARTKLYVTLTNFVPPEFREGNPPRAAIRWL